MPDWTGRRFSSYFAYHSPDFLYRSATIDFRYKGLRRNIERTHHHAKATPWPHSACYLQIEATKLPSSLLEFLTLLITGKSHEQSTDKAKRLRGSFAEDICSATIRGRWNVAKYQLLGLTLHHLRGKAVVVTILHRYGHCTSYTGILELETAMANQVQQHDSLLPSNISLTGIKVTHLCWDNFDLNEETPSGIGTTHTTHGILVQEVPRHCAVETWVLSISTFQNPKSGASSQQFQYLFHFPEKPMWNRISKLFHHPTTVL